MTTTETQVAAEARPEVAEDTAGPAEQDSDAIEEELLVEEISIDGMCGVY